MKASAKGIPITIDGSTGVLPPVKVHSVRRVLVVTPSGHPMPALATLWKGKGGPLRVFSGLFLSLN